MAITNYNELLSATMNWTDRSGSGFIARMPEFVTFFESTANRRLRVNNQISSTVLTADVNGLVTLPTDFLEWKRVAGANEPVRPLEYLEPYQLTSDFPFAGTGIPRYFSIEGAYMKVRPVDTTTGSIQFLYYTKIPALAASASTNWLLTSHPDCYLAGTLAEATMFAEGPEMAQVWMAKRDAAFAEIERLSQQSRGQMQMRGQMSFNDGPRSGRGMTYSDWLLG